MEAVVHFCLDRQQKRGPSVIWPGRWCFGEVTWPTDERAAGGGRRWWRRGFFAAITCAEAFSGSRITLLEKSAQFLSKVRISGGGRCNVTYACFDGRELSSHSSWRASAAGPFQYFQPRDTIAWFESRGVKLKTEEDGRIFPVTDSSQTVIGLFAPRRQCRWGRNHPEPARGERGTPRDGTFELTLAKPKNLDANA